MRKLARVVVVVGEDEIKNKSSFPLTQCGQMFVWAELPSLTTNNYKLASEFKIYSKEQTLAARRER